MGIRFKYSKMIIKNFFAVGIFGNSVYAEEENWNPLRDVVKSATNYVTDHLRVNPFLATFVNREDSEEAEICYDSDVGCISGWRKGDSTRKFLKGKPVFITVHGWDSWADYWVRPIKEEIFTFFKGDVNTIVVEWKYGADRTYPQAVGNARVIGRQIKNIITNLMSDGVVEPSAVTIIGHSVGAQVAA